MKPLRRVYRIEHSVHRFGPWANDLPDHVQFIAGASCDQPDDHPAHMPCPWRDRLVRSAEPAMLQHTRHAYPDVATLLRWWSAKWRQLAHENGYVVGVYGVGWISHELYRNQVLYNASDATHLRDLSLLELEAATAALPRAA